ncbi:MAG: hypothetical protein V4754_09535 [Pseudomonadota bacterium]
MTITLRNSPSSLAASVPPLAPDQRRAAAAPPCAQQTPLWSPHVPVPRRQSDAAGILNTGDNTPTQERDMALHMFGALPQDGIDARTATGCAGMADTLHADAPGPTLERDLIAIDKVLRQALSETDGQASAGADEHGHGHHHDKTMLDRVLKKCLGTSDLDEAPHAVVGAKAGATNVAAPGGDEHASRLQQFQHHSVPHSGGELGVDMALSGVMGSLGLMAMGAGHAEIHEAKEEKVDLGARRTVLLEQQKSFAAAHQEVAHPGPDETAAQHAKRTAIAASLAPQMRLIEWELGQIDFKLRHNGRKQGLGAGSRAAGAAMTSKGAIDMVTKLMAHLDAGAAPVAASVSGFATLPLSPLAAACGLYMGANSLVYSQAQLKEYRKNMALALEHLGVEVQHLPQQVQADYQRFFQDGKWESRESMLKSFRNLMTCFTGGMAGYTVGMTGLSALKIAALVGTAAALDAGFSGGVIASTALVMFGTVGFLRYHAKLHEHEDWANSADPEVDRDLLNQLAAHGGAEVIDHAVALLRTMESKEERRQDFLFDVAKSSGLRFDGVKTHSTDMAELSAKRTAQRGEAGTNATQRFLASRGMTAQNARAVGHAAAGLAGTAARHSTSASAWHQAWRDARDKVRTQTGHAHGHGHAHAHGEQTHEHDEHGSAPEAPVGAAKAAFRSFKSGLGKGVSPFKKGAKVVGKTGANVLKPAFEAAAEVHASHTDYLVERNLATLLNAPEHHGAIVALMEEDASAMESYLERKLDDKAALLDLSDEAADALPPEVAEHRRGMAQGLAHDKKLYLEAGRLTEALRTRQQEAANGTAPAQGAMAKLQTRYLALMNGGASPAAKDADPARQMARHLMKQAPERYRANRSRLHTTLLEATPLLQAHARDQAQAATAAQAAAGAWQAGRAKDGAPRIVNRAEALATPALPSADQFALG